MTRLRKLRMGMIGGGPGALIGQTHRKAARMDGRIELVAGAFSSDPAKSRQQGEELFLDPTRVYGSWREFIDAEGARPAGDKLDFIAVVTPNYLHLEPSLAALAAGFHLVLDKPMTLTSAEAKQLGAAAAAGGKLLALTHPLSALAMVQLGRDLVRGGRLGVIRKINAEYRQGWLHQRIEDNQANKQAVWRTDPALSGAGCLADIGTHLFNLAERIGGLKLEAVAAEVATLVPGRRNDDDFSLLARWENKARGVLHASQALAGAESGLAIQVHGDRASLTWSYRENERLILHHPDRPAEVWTRGSAAVAATSPAAARDSRNPGCHPEGSQEGFANIYANFADAILRLEAGEPTPPAGLGFPTAEEGIRGMLFVEATLASSRAAGKWTKLEGTS